VVEKVKEVVIHEVGHYFGLDDERLRELETNDSNVTELDELSLLLIYD
jgi:predicted Zn-dependent protease